MKEQNYIEVEQILEEAIDETRKLYRNQGQTGIKNAQKKKERERAWETKQLIVTDLMHKEFF